MRRFDAIHPDRGSQYTSLAFGRTMQDAGVMPSMGRRGDAFDNAVAESFFATLETELLDRSTFRSRDQARLALSKASTTPPQALHARTAQPSAIRRDHD